MKGILGKKIGMTQVYLKTGEQVPVTIIEIPDNIVIGVKTEAKEGYKSLKLAAFDKRENLVNKPDLGQFKKSNTNPKCFIKEIANMEGWELGSMINAGTIFKKGEYIDVTAISKGKGTQGRVKRHNQKIGPMSHGSGFHRQMGSTGAIAANKVFKGTKMPGRMGNKKTTIQNLLIIDINQAQNYIVVKGSVPGAKYSYVTVKSAIKKPKAIKSVTLNNWDNNSQWNEQGNPQGNPAPAG